MIIKNSIPRRLIFLIKLIETKYNGSDDINFQQNKIMKCCAIQISDIIKHLQVEHPYTTDVQSAAVGVQLAFSWRPVGVQLAFSWRSVGVRLAFSWRSVGVQLAFSWRSVGVQLASSWRSAGVQLASSWHGISAGNC